MEAELYESIVEIPHYESKWLQMLDKEDEEELVATNFEDFQRLYRPIIEEHFSEILKIDDKGVVTIDGSNEARRELMSHINDNIFQNLDEKFRV